MNAIMTYPLEDLVGLKISIIWKKAQSEESMSEGSVVAASNSGLLVKPRGASLAELIASTEIVDLNILRDPNSKIILRRLRLVKVGEVRQHLADRHGLTLDFLDEYDDLQFLQYHITLDHSNLSHIHEDKKAGKLVQAISNAEQEAKDDNPACTT